MKKIILFTTLLAFLFGCSNNNQQIDFNQLPKILNTDLVVMIETDKYLVLSNLENFNSNFKLWIREHDYLKNDNELFAAMKHVIDKQSKKSHFIVVRADSVAKARGLTKRLEYRASDLLQANKCFVYNKRSKLIESKVTEFSFSDLGYEGHGFSVNKDIIMKVIDRVY